jgi:hypothetical protein
MLSGKLDSGIWTELQNQICTAALISTNTCGVQRATATAPSDSWLAQKAAELTKKLNSMPSPNMPLHSWPILQVAQLSQMQHIFFWSQLTQILTMTQTWSVLRRFRLYFSSLIFYIFQKDYASSVWAVIERFGQHRFRDELDSSNIHHLVT